MSVPSIEKRLFDLQDLTYKDFQAKLMPTVEKERIIGVRTPLVRAMAKDILKNEKELAEEFMADLPHKYYEENNLHSFILELCKDYDKTIKLLYDFLPYVDNWATCDSMSPKIFKKHKPELLIEIKRWIKSSQVYTIRFGVEMLMSLYLDEDFKPEYLELLLPITDDDYYVRMMIAWFFATALAKQWDATIPYIVEKKLPVWIHNKSIQKAVESYRITPEQKDYLRTLKIKK